MPSNKSWISEPLSYIHLSTFSVQQKQTRAALFQYFWRGLFAARLPPLSVLPVQPLISHMEHTSKNDINTVSSTTTGSLSDSTDNEAFPRATGDWFEKPASFKWTSSVLMLEENPQHYHWATEANHLWYSIHLLLWCTEQRESLNDPFV